MFFFRKSRKQTAVRIVSFLLTFAFLGSFLLTFAKVPDAAASSLSDLQDRYNKLEEEQKDISNKLSSLKNNAEAAKKRAGMIQDQITATQQQLDLLSQQIHMQNVMIQDKQVELEHAHARIETYKDRCLKRLRASYTSSTAGALSLLMESGSLTDFLLRSEYLRSTMEYDNALLARLKKDQDEIAAAKKDIEAKKAGIVAAKQQADLKQKNLNQQYADKQNNIQNIYRDQASLKAYQQKITKEKEKINAQIAEMIENSGDGGQFVGGKWLFPLNFRNWYISSYYGWRTLYGVPNFHTGIDFTGGGIYGAQVVASNPGRVYSTVVSQYGYGNHIVIDHGGGNFTLYAHLSAIQVQQGQTVRKGQVIGRVGSTGNSTGPHLHFELFLNKKRVNPYSYLFG